MTCKWLITKVCLSNTLELSPLQLPNVARTKNLCALKMSHFGSGPIQIVDNNISLFVWSTHRREKHTLSHIAQVSCFFFSQPPPECPLLSSLSLFLSFSLILTPPSFVFCVKFPSGKYSVQNVPNLHVHCARLMAVPQASDARVSMRTQFPKWLPEYRKKKR